MDEEDGVNVLDSLTNENGSKDPSAEGKKPSKTSDDRPEINRVMEENRKLREQMSRHQETIENLQSSIEQLKGITNRNPYQDDLLARKEDNLRKLMNHPEAQDWIELQKRIAREEAKREWDEREEKRLKAEHSEDNERAQAWVKSKARELNMKSDELAESIIAILKGDDPEKPENRWGDLLPTERVKRAFNEWKKYQDMSKASSKKEGEFTEGEGRTARLPSKKTEIDQAKQSGKFQDILKKVSGEQESALEKARLR